MFSVLCRRECRDALIPLPSVTAKTVFLLRCRPVNAVTLSFPPTFAESLVSLPLNEEYIPKSYFICRNQSRIGPLFIPMCLNPELQQVCPVGTLLFYLDVSSRFLANLSYYS